MLLEFLTNLLAVAGWIFLIRGYQVFNEHAKQYQRISKKL
jgi:hypothetical protein